MKPTKEPRKKNGKRVEIENVTVDPIVVDLPKLKANFIRFETSEDGQKFFVVYEFVTQ